MIRYLLQALLLGLLLVIVKPANAGIEEKLDNAFDVMANYTEPSIHMGARRGVITGGSLSIRTPMVNIRPFSLRGPSISIGCGGIDAFFGAFSFISKEQLVQAMRAIVTAAISYAFQLALEAMCPTCATVLSKLQDYLNQANSALTNSCEATRNFMDDNQISAAITRTAEQWRFGSGESDDPEAAKGKGDTNSSAAAAGANSAGQVYVDLPAEGNQVWQILKKSGDASFDTGSNDFFEEIMSMTGTVVVCVAGETGCAEEGIPGNGGEHVGQSGELVVFRKAPVLTLTSLVTGQAAEPKQYSCGGDYAKCKKPSVVTNPIEGMAQKIRVAFLGTGGTNNSSSSMGIINKMRFNYSTAPTDEELKWMKVGGSLTGMLFRLAEKDPGAARGFVQDNADAIAAEIIVGYIDKYMLSAQVAAGRTEQKGLKEAYELIMAASQKAHDDAQVFYNQAAKNGTLYNGFNERINSLAK